MKILENPTNEQLAYLAGYFDGEGTISVSFRRAKSQGALGIIVRTGDGACIQRFQSAFGGNISRYAPAINGKILRHRTIFSWTAHGIKAQQILRALLPYLCAKQEQAILALQMNFNKMGSPVSVEEKEKRFLIGIQVRELKKTQTLPISIN